MIENVVLNNNNIVQGIPTVTAGASFDARADADVLHKAMKGMGTDEKALISILCHRTSSQRTAINQAYKSGYGKVYNSHKFNWISFYKSNINRFSRI